MISRPKASISREVPTCAGHTIITAAEAAFSGDLEGANLDNRQIIFCIPNR